MGVLSTSIIEIFRKYEIVQSEAREVNVNDNAFNINTLSRIYYVGTNDEVILHRKIILENQKKIKVIIEISNDNEVYKINENNEIVAIEARNLEIGDRLYSISGNYKIIEMEYVPGRSTEIFTESGLLNINNILISSYSYPSINEKISSYLIKHLSKFHPFLSTKIFFKPLNYVTNKIN